MRSAYGVFFLLLFHFGTAQSSFELKLLPLDQSAEFIKKEVKFEQIHKDSFAVFRELESIIFQLQSKAYLEASVDTISLQDSIVVALLHIGRTYKWKELKNGNIPANFLKKIGFREKLFNEKKFSATQINRIKNQLLEKAENNGFPFARVWLDDFKAQNQQISAALYMDKGPLTLLDSLNIKGDASISKNYLSHYLGLKTGEVYNKDRIIRSRERLKELAFIQPIRDPNIQFREDKAMVNLYINKKRASRFDFLIGVLPNSAQTGKLLITGTFNGELQNQFGGGERIYARFEQLRPLTQELNIQFNYPYIFNTPFGTDLNFELYRRDTNYITIIYDLGIQYLLEGGNYIKAFWNNTQTNLLSVDTSKIILEQQLPDTLDVRYSSFGVEYNWSQLDYRLNPRKGFFAKLRANAGIKQISPNNTILSSDRAAGLYDSIQLRSFQYNVQASLAAYFPLLKRSTIKAGVQVGFTFSEQPIYANEQFRIGGTQLLRGFDEESIFATSFAIFTLEYRLLLGQNSFLYTFFDYASIEAETINIKENTLDDPLGFGAGISFETKAGIFGISLAYGRQRSNPIDFGAPKVHFGYISLF